MKLYYFETPNAHKACAVARYLDAPVEFVRVDLTKGEHKAPRFLAINPNGKVPALQDGEMRLWESAAIMAYLADKAGSDLWPKDARQIDVIRWLTWDATHFSRHAGTLFFEQVVKPRFGLGEPNLAAIDEAMGFFRQFAGVLDSHLKGRKYLVGDGLTIADFAVGSLLPHARQAKLPIDEFAEISRWYTQLEKIPGWQEPFPRQEANAA
ncbi:MAG TPA: glutathione S-transferase family protein [Geminicoccaceae bacterium]|jgi:glutathione S-transferase|nr:glutathione S-transferase family protein [Geminicoccaceae bacterium]